MSAKRGKPLYASEEQVAEMVLGPGRLRDWKDRVPMLEREGLPKVDLMMGGRYLPAVRTFFDQRNGVILGQNGKVVLKVPDGKDNVPCSRPRSAPRQKLEPPTPQVSNGAAAKADNVFPIGSRPETQ